MAYSEDYRKRVIEYRKEGHTLMDTQKVFKVAIITIRTWETKLKEEGTLKKKPVIRPFRKLDPEKLKMYLKDHADAYLREIAAEFGCCETAVSNACRKLKITRKKRPRLIKSRIPKGSQNMMKK